MSFNLHANSLILYYTIGGRPTTSANNVRLTKLVFCIRFFICSIIDIVWKRNWVSFLVELSLNAVFFNVRKSLF